MATAGVVAGTVVGNKIWNGSKWVVKAVTTTAAVTGTTAAATAAAEKKAADKVIISAGKKLGIRYAGAAAFGPWAGFAAIGITLGAAGFGAWDAIANESEKLTGKTAETITIMDKMQVGVAGAINAVTVGIIETKTAYDLMNMEIITWGKTGADKGILNKLWDGPSFLPEWLTKKRFAGEESTDAGVTTVIGAVVDPRIQFMLDQVEAMDLHAAAIDKVANAMKNLKNSTSDLYTENGSLTRFGEQLIIIGHQAAGITKVKDSMVELIKSTSTNEAHISAGVITTMAAQMGKLDDKMNDWDKGELSNLKSITKSLGQMTGAGDGKLLTEIKEILVLMNANVQANVGSVNFQGKAMIRAVRESSPYINN